MYYVYKLEKDKTLRTTIKGKVVFGYIYHGYKYEIFFGEFIKVFVKLGIMVCYEIMIVQINLR